MIALSQFQVFAKMLMTYPLAYSASITYMPACLCIILTASFYYYVGLLTLTLALALALAPNVYKPLASSVM